MDKNNKSLDKKKSIKGAVKKIIPVHKAKAKWLVVFNNSPFMQAIHRTWKKSENVCLFLTALVFFALLVLLIVLGATGVIKPSM